MVVPPFNSALNLVRDAVCDWTRRRGFREWPLTLIATELVANAIAVTPAEHTIELVVTTEAGHIKVSVTDPGPGFGPGTYPWLLDDVPMPSSSSPRGRGLAMVRHLCEQLRVDRVGSLTVVSALQPMSLAEDVGRPAD